MSQPELYYIERTPYVPGSKLPVIVYRGAVAQCANDDEIKEVLEANGGWEKGVYALGTCLLIRWLMSVIGSLELVLSRSLPSQCSRMLWHCSRII